jgi:hypothetical protein
MIEIRARINVVKGLITIPYERSDNSPTIPIIGGRHLGRVGISHRMKPGSGGTPQAQRRSLLMLRN